MQIVNFKNMQLPKTPNYYLVCPENYCNVEANRAPKFNVNVNDLINAFDKMVKSQPRVKLTMPPLGLHYQYVQRSLIMRFPDYIDVEFIAINNHTSTLAIFSRSRYGRYDFQVNKKRVDSWLEQLSHYINQ